MKKMIISSTLILSMTAFIINFCACGNKAAEAPACHAEPIAEPVEQALAQEAPEGQVSEQATRGRLTNGEVVELSSEGQFNQLVAQGNVLVDFYGVNCPPCKALSPVIHDLAQENKHITFIKVNTASFGALSSQFRVTGIPTLIYFKNGQKVDKSVGGQSKSNLQAKLNSVFPR